MKGRVEETYHLVVSRMELDILADGVKTIAVRYDVPPNENGYHLAAVEMGKNFDRLRGFTEPELQAAPEGNHKHHLEKREAFRQAYSAGGVPVADNPQA